MLFFVALTARLALGRLHGANPVLTFYPAILLAALMLGWKEAVLILAMSIGVGTYLFIPARMYLQPLAWLTVGGLNIAIIAGLQHLAQELATANERQRILFAELQHRVANTLQAAVGTFELAQGRIRTSPEEAARLLESASTKMAAAADVHRRLHDPALFERGVKDILRDAVSNIIDPGKVDLSLDVAPLELTFDQMSTITMVVVEAANNAWKHVFQHGQGSKFEVSLQAVTADSALLVVRNDGAARTGARPAEPCPRDAAGAGAPNTRLGLRIIEGLAKQIGGKLAVGSCSAGAELRLEFPLRRHHRAAPSGSPA